MNSNLILVFLFVLTTMACDTEIETNTSRPDFIIDAHIHYKPTDEWESTFVKVYTEHKAMACLSVRANDLERGIGFAKEHPDLVIPYAAIDINSPTVTDDIRRVRDMGYKGLGELFATKGWNYDNTRYDSVWILAEQFGMPILPHTGIHASGNFSGMKPSFVASIAEKHRGLTIHAAHFGNPWYAEAGESARLNPNLYFDISGTSLIKKDLDPGIWGQYLWWTPYLGKPHVGTKAGPAWENILFSTDETGAEENLIANIVRFNKMLDANNVPDETRKNMYGMTMAKIHGIESVHGFVVQ